MYRTFEPIKRSSSSKTFTTTDPQFFQAPKQKVCFAHSKRTEYTDAKRSFVHWKFLNHNVEKRNIRMTTFDNTTSDVHVFPQNVRRIYFTYINPSSLEIRKEIIETHVHTDGRHFHSEWEKRYFQLSKQLETFLLKHETTIQELQVQLSKGKAIKTQMEAENEQLHIVKTQLLNDKANLEDMLGQMQLNLAEKNVQILELQQRLNIDKFNEMQFKTKREDERNERTIDSKNQSIEVDEKERGRNENLFYFQRNKQTESLRIFESSRYQQRIEESYFSYHEKRVFELTQILKEKDEIIIRLSEEMKKLEKMIAQNQINYSSNVMFQDYELKEKYWRQENERLIMLHQELEQNYENTTRMLEKEENRCIEYENKVTLLALQLLRMQESLNLKQETIDKIEGTLCMKQETIQKLLIRVEHFEHCSTSTQSFQRELDLWISRYNDATSTIERMKLEIIEISAKLNSRANAVARSAKQLEIDAYFCEKLRSLLIEVGTLQDQLSIEASSRNESIKKCLKVCFESMFQILVTFNSEIRTEASMI